MAPPCELGHVTSDVRPRVIYLRQGFVSDARIVLGVKQVFRKVPIGPAWPGVRVRCLWLVDRGPSASVWMEKQSGIFGVA